MKPRSGATRVWALAALLGMAANCAHADDRLNLLIWINGDKGYTGLQKVGDGFTRASGVTVVVQHPEDAPSKFQQAAGAGKGPDIFCWPHDRVGEFAKSGLIVPVTPGKKIRDEIDDAAWKAFSYQGKTWGYPLAIEAIGLIYNKALVKTAPTSFAEVIALDKKLSASGKKAIIWDFNTAFFTWPLLAGSGGYVFGRDAAGNLDPQKIGVNTPGAVAAVELLGRMVADGQLPRGVKYSQAEGAFDKGDVAMMISGPWAWENARRSKIDFGVAPIPAIDGHPAKPFVGVLGCMITASSQVKDIAREFIEHHLLTLDGLKTVNADVPLGTPANKALYQQLSADPTIRATMDNARHGEALPNIPEAGRFFTAVDAALEAVTNGRQSAQQALDAAAARIAVK
ncbi:MAG: maltose/maltodextrin ABC transporter substrate-binding protein MalE [Pseudomonadota bacterium]|nr:maltose/maltodextrin ABC transporter substrate-binding protein MalE [Pseudomonadota bacterium]